MEMCFGSKGVNSFLRVRLGEGMEIETAGYGFQIQMLEENVLPYIIQPARAEMDGSVFLQFDTSSLYLLERMFQRVKPDGGLFRLLMEQIYACIVSLEKYLLTADNLVLDPAYIFYDHMNREVRLIYAPGYGRNVKLQLKKLLEYMMQSFDVRDERGLRLLYGLYDAVAAEETDMEALRSLVQMGDACRERISQVEDNGGEQLPQIKHGPPRVTYRRRLSPYRFVLLVINAAALLFMLFRFLCFGGSRIDIYVCVGLFFVLGVNLACIFCGREEEADLAMREYQERTAAGPKADRTHALPEYEARAEAEVKPKGLVPLTNGALKEIRLDGNRELIVVGRGRKDSDYRLSTTQISRIHACIYTRKEGIFIEDRNSTNGTYLNSVRIPALEPQKLNRGDIVSFANEDFFVS